MMGQIYRINTLVKFQDEKRKKLLIFQGIKYDKVMHRNLFKNTLQKV